MKKILSLVKQFFKFGIVGISNTLISLAVYYLFVWTNNNLYIIGNIVGFIVSTLNAYFWNSKFVFKKSEKKNSVVIVKTFISYGISLGLSSALLYLTVEVLHISEFIAPIIGLVITVPLNFLMNKFWVYKEKGETNNEHN